MRGPARAGRALSWNLTGIYKAVIFDLGKVLIHFDFKRGYQALEGLCPYPAAEIPQRIGSSDLVERFETGLVEPRDFVAQLSRILDLNVDYDGFCAIWNSIFTDPLIPEAMLEGLAARYRLLLLSNTNAIHFEAIRRNYPLLRHFHALILSYEVKAMKPRAGHLRQGRGARWLPARRVLLHGRYRRLRGSRACAGYRRRAVSFGRADPGGTRGARHPLARRIKKPGVLRGRPAEEPYRSARRWRMARVEEIVTPTIRRVPGRPLPSP